MPDQFTCPNCGAPLEYTGSGKTVRCPFCHTNVIVPAELRPKETTLPRPPSRPAWPLFLGLAIAAVLALLLVVRSFTSSSLTVQIAESPALPGTATAVPRASTPTRTPSATPTPGFASLIAKMGGKGTGPGLFTDVRSVAVDGSGNIYAADYTGGRVQVFDARGNFQHLWTIDPKASVFSLAADRKGRVYVAQGGAILRFDGATGEALGPLAYDKKGDGFGSITPLADGGLLGVWYEGRWGIITSVEGHREDFVRFDANGKVAQVIQGPVSGQTGDAELDVEVAVDGLGTIYALAGTFDNAVFQYTPAGKFVNRFGSKGSEPGQFQFPSAIAVDNQSRLYIADSSTIHIFDKDGRYLRSFKPEAPVSALAIGPQNELVAAGGQYVYKYVLNLQ